MCTGGSYKGVIYPRIETLSLSFFLLQHYPSTHKLIFLHCVTALYVWQYMALLLPPYLAIQGNAVVLWVVYLRNSYSKRYLPLHQPLTDTQQLLSIVLLVDQIEEQLLFSEVTLNYALSRSKFEEQLLQIGRADTPPPHKNRKYRFPRRPSGKN